jgi:hypothetical protein
MYIVHVFMFCQYGCRLAFDCKCDMYFTCMGAKMKYILYLCLKVKNHIF